MTGHRWRKCGSAGVFAQGGARPGAALLEAICVMCEALTEAEVSQKAGAERYARRETRRTGRNGYRERTWATRVGEIALHIPRCATAATSPACWGRGARSGGCWRWCSGRTSKA